MSAPHLPVMPAEILEFLSLKPGGYYIDGTAGAGGHSFAILQAEPSASVMALDRDPAAVQLATERLQGMNGLVVHDSYLQMAVHAAVHFDTTGVDGIVLDFGVSSMQLDQPERGFAFRHDGPLDMRFDPTSDAPTAAELLNELPADVLADILYRYGEEKNSRKIARAVIEARPITTTTQLASIIASVARSREKIHPATRSFQALRIAVNEELQAVEQVMPLAIDCLKPGGRLTVLTFHSLEDRIVKRAFKEASTDCICPPKQPVCTCDHHATVKLVTRKPVMAQPSEIDDNPRARSAKLRVIQRLPD